MNFEEIETIETLSEDEILSIYFDDVEERLSVTCEISSTGPLGNYNVYSNRPHSCCRKGWDCPSNAYFPYAWYGECTHTISVYCTGRGCTGFDPINNSLVRCVR